MRNETTQTHQPKGQKMSSNNHQPKGQEMSSTWEDYRAELEKLARDNLRVATCNHQWAVISLTKFWGETSNTPEVMCLGYTSERAAQLRLEAYVHNFSDIDSRINRASPAPNDRGSWLEPDYFNEMADKEAVRERQLGILRLAGAEKAEVTLDAILAEQTAKPNSDDDLSIPF